MNWDDDFCVHFLELYFLKLVSIPFNKNQINLEIEVENSDFLSLRFGQMSQFSAQNLQLLPDNCRSDNCQFYRESVTTVNSFRNFSRLKFQFITGWPLANLIGNYRVTAVTKSVGYFSLKIRIFGVK